MLATNIGSGYRRGAVRQRSQSRTPNGSWTKRDDATGRCMAEQLSPSYIERSTDQVASRQRPFPSPGRAARHSDPPGGAS